jgi:signal peptidase II
MELDKQDNINRPSSGWACCKSGGVRLPSLKAHLIFWSVLAGGVVLDLWSKKAVFAWLENSEHGSVSVIKGFIHLVTAVNDGAAFGMFSGHPGRLIAVSVTALAVVLIAFLFGGSEHKLTYAVLGLFAAGICGNLYDRIFNNGFVRDFIDVVVWPGRHWPAFNIADSMLCIAMALLIVSSLFTEQSSGKHVPQRK